MFNVTTAAAQEILAAAERSDAVGMGLRVAARQMSDGSLDYGMGFDEAREDDEPAVFDGLTVLVGAPSKPLLAGTVLDYVEVAPGHFDFIFLPVEERAAADGASAPQAGGGGGGGCGSGACRQCGG